MTRRDERDWDPRNDDNWEDQRERIERRFGSGGEGGWNPERYEASSERDRGYRGRQGGEDRSWNERGGQYGAQYAQGSRQGYGGTYGPHAGAGQSGYGQGGPGQFSGGRGGYTPPGWGSNHGPAEIRYRERGGGQQHEWDSSHDVNRFGNSSSSAWNPSGSGNYSNWDPSSNSRDLGSRNNGSYNYGGSSYGSEQSDSSHFANTLRGGFAGKGPRGYVRSDERIKEDVSDRLSMDDETDASDITVTVSQGEVTLEGTVPDRHSKHRAEDIADNVNGVKDVHNRLRANKGLVQEVGDKIMGRETNTGHFAGTGTKNAPTGTSSTAQQPNGRS